MSKLNKEAVLLLILSVLYLLIVKEELSIITFTIIAIIIAVYFVYLITSNIESQSHKATPIYSLQQIVALIVILLATSISYFEIYDSLIKTTIGVFGILNFGVMIYAYLSVSKSRQAVIGLGFALLIFCSITTIIT
ncbi:hypothetical protein [Haloflavibacter putidus]|uniref:Uncharacterized protein n=1 Tax=Haloflavibacter putidus TaxID=2576776 RepID=A0A507ZSV6_9FLAO|nr:hypothetical protein [Haloflavibacter putidus]TQD40469.1 hypothetical protein FKR84_00395 [Haloflavibacter putidus]